jgi:hypothetical protein
MTVLLVMLDSETDYSFHKIILVITKFLTEAGLSEVTSYYVSWLEPCLQ